MIKIFRIHNRIRRLLSKKTNLFIYWLNKIIDLIDLIDLFIYLYRYFYLLNNKFSN